MIKIVNRIGFAFVTACVCSSLAGCFISHREVKEQTPVVEPAPPLASSTTTTTTTKSDDGAVQRSTTTHSAPMP